MKRFIKTIIPEYLKEKIKSVFGLKKIDDSSSNMFWLRKYDIDSIIDIGANDGQFVNKIIKVFDNKKIYCFEPLRNASDILRKNTKSNKNIEIINSALGEFEGNIEMNRCEFSPSSSILEMDKLHKDAFPWTLNSIKESTIIKKLDNIAKIKNNCKRPFIKMDTQGYEMRIINGGIETFKRAPIVMTEVSYHVLYKDQPLFDDIYKKFIDLGFMYAGNIEQLLDPRDLKPLQADAIFINNNL